jgi:hypothetical protein
MEDSRMTPRDLDLLIRDAQGARHRIEGPDARNLDRVADAVRELSKVVEKLATAVKEQDQAKRRAQRDA